LNAGRCASAQLQMPRLPVPPSALLDVIGAEQFARRAARDPLGRSLRDLDLTRRLFRYPLSFVIHSPAFDALPDAAQRAFYYPDAMLVCDDADDHPEYKERPCFIAEVLSPATANIDAREKWLHYRELPSLRYYLMVDSERVWARLLSRAGEGRWLEQQLDAGEVVRIECGGLAIALSLEDLYEDTGLSFG